MPPEAAYTDFNYANGWMNKVPQLVKECDHKAPDRVEMTVGRCVRRVICHKCRYTYLIDSSD